MQQARTGLRAQNGVVEDVETLDKAEGWLDSRPSLALARAQAVLRRDPKHVGARRLAAKAHWRLAETHDRPEAALANLRAATRLAPDSPDLWISLGDTLRASGLEAQAGDAYMQAVRTAVHHPVLAAAAEHMNQGRLAQSEQILRARLWRRPTDVAAIRMLGELAARLGRTDDAVSLLSRSVVLAPGFDTAREMLARLLAHHRPEDALPHIDALIARSPANLSHQMLKASVLVRLGEQAQARGIYEALLATDGNQPAIWMSLGHVLKTLGDADKAIVAYRRAIAQKPDLGEAWWSLANLKTFRFAAEELAAMQSALPQSRDEDRMHLDFALGKALEDAGDYEASFAHYDAGNRRRRLELSYSADDTTRQCDELRRLFTPAFLASRRDRGCPDAAPIFIVGLPRSGSTLIEQILATHSQVEGTMELPDLIAIASRLQADTAAPYPRSLATLDAAALQALGREYIDRTRIHRKTDRPFFIDKMPNNWQHVGLIQLILPNARIIDARRHPMGCCFSAWKQHFARGQAFSYDQVDVARYYADYVALMDALDAAAPGRIHRVVYEDLVLDTEAGVRRLLNYVGLPFEEACLSFWRNQRPVRTASSEQVRRPIFTDGVDHWRRFTPWLGPMIERLAPLAPAAEPMVGATA